MRIDVNNSRKKVYRNINRQLCKRCKRYLCKDCFDNILYIILLNIYIQLSIACKFDRTIFIYMLCKYCRRSIDTNNNKKEVYRDNFSCVI